MDLSTTSSKIKVYSLPSCIYCQQLCEKLTEMNLAFIRVNVSEHQQEFEAVVKHSGCSDLPMILVKDKLLIPEVSFRSITEAAVLTYKINKGLE